MAHEHEHSKQKNIRIAFFLNLAFTVLEIVGGIWTNSIAILSDALHDLGDSFSLGLAWYLEHLSSKGPDKKYSFGYARFSLLGAFINSLVLVAGSVLILTRAIPRIISPQPVNSEGILIFAIIGIVVNSIAVIRLRRGSSLNEKVVSWHLLEDVLGWAVLLIGSIIMIFADLPVLDPILSMLITLFVLYNVVINLRKIWKVFLQGVPEGISIEKVEKSIREASGALSAYHTHIWSLDGQKNLLSIHLVVSDDIKRSEIINLKRKVRETAAAMGMEHVTVEIDFQSETAGVDCF